MDYNIYLVVEKDNDTGHKRVVFTSDSHTQAKKLLHIAEKQVNHSKHYHLYIKHWVNGNWDD